jgi:hypothetical protein
MFLGVYKQIQRISGNPKQDLDNERNARVAQGREEARTMTQEEKESIINTWRCY